jgi:hypothetical protein
MTREELAEHLRRGDEVVIEDSLVRKMFPETLQESSRNQIKKFCDERFTVHRHDEQTGKHHFVPRAF